MACCKRQASSAMNCLSSARTRVVDSLRTPIQWLSTKSAGASARNPKITVALCTVLSLGIFIAGLCTNFEVDVDETAVWTPTGSKSLQHHNWVDEASGFPNRTRQFLFIFNDKDQGNVLGQDQVARVFEVLDAIRSLPEYETACSSLITPSDADADAPNCTIRGVTQFWDNNVTVFEEQVQSDEDAIQAMSASSFRPHADETWQALFDYGIVPGEPALEEYLFGYPVREQNNSTDDDDNRESSLLVSAKSFLLSIDLPGETASRKQAARLLETAALDMVANWNAAWNLEPDVDLRVHAVAERSYTDEFIRALVQDIPLVPVVFLVMSLFTSAVFFKRDKVRSRSLLGLTAVIAVLFGVISGYGLMFAIGVPFTNLSQILTFIYFGVGLDDAFIITGHFDRTDAKKSPVDRIVETIDEVGLSIFLTTTTSSLAFALGCGSKIPAIYWLCIYAVPTLMFILFYQLTFFVACIVLDERRIQANNRDCFRCISCWPPKTDDSAAQSQSIIDRFMTRYSELLMKRTSKILVVLFFTSLTIACGVSASKLEQHFDFVNIVPKHSYVKEFFDVYDDVYEGTPIEPSAYFFNVNQSDPTVRDQMEAYMGEIVNNVDAVGSPPDHCWMSDFRQYLNQTNDTSSTMGFTEQMDGFLENFKYGLLYRRHIVRDENGTITASRCAFRMDLLDIHDDEQQMLALRQQRSVSESVIDNEDQHHFFTYHPQYDFWEFYLSLGAELKSNTFYSILAVTCVTFLLVPHWSASVIVLPLIAMLYVDLLGIMQWAGIKINPVSAITLIVSVGLLVDFLLHVLLRYYEVAGTRREKVLNVLPTMGSSILLGAITTFLGTIPLVFSTSEFFHTVLISGMALVTVGASHGLILLPVLLSLFGPEDSTEVVTKEGKKDLDETENDSFSGSDEDEEGMMGVELGTLA